MNNKTKYSKKYKQIYEKYSLTDEIIEAEQCAHNLLVRLHDDVNPGADTLVDQFCSVIKHQVINFYVIIIKSYHHLPSGNTVDGLISGVVVAMILSR